MQKRSSWCQGKNGSLRPRLYQGEALVWPGGPPPRLGPPFLGMGTQIPSKSMRILSALETKPRLQRKFRNTKCSLHEKKVNFSLKKTNSDRGKKANQLQMGSCFIQVLCCQWGRPELSDRMGKWDTPTSSLIHSAMKYFSLHWARLLGTSNGP